MRSLVTNLMITLGEKQADATPALIDQVIAPKLTAFARNMAHTLCNYWYLSQNSSYKLCSPTNVVCTSATGSSKITFQPDNFACHRFTRGQRVDIVYVSTGARANENGGTGATVAVGAQTRSSRFNLVVESVDPLTNVVVLVVPISSLFAVAGSGFRASGGTAIGSNDALVASTIEGVLTSVVYANTTMDTAGLGTNIFTGIAGINSWLKNGAETGTNNTKLLGNEADGTDFIDVAARPEFKSFKYDVAGGALTEYNMKRYLQRVHSAFEPAGNTIDTLIASEGVWSAYESQKIGQYRIDRTNKVSSITNEGSQEGFTFSFEGHTYKGSTSRFVEGGTMYGIKLGGKNWKKYIPPSPAGLSKMSQADAYVPFEFVAGAITGTSTNQLPIYQTGPTGGPSLVTQASQMPGRIRMQLVPDQPNGMKLVNIAEDRLYMGANNIL
jgi:hypothetical protein